MLLVNDQLEQFSSSKNKLSSIKRIPVDLICIKSATWTMLPGKDITTTSLLLLSPPLKPHHLLPKMFHPRQNIRTSPHLPINQDITSFHKPKPRDTFLRELISRKAHSADVFDAELVPKIGEKPFPGFNPVALTMVLCKEDETDILDMLESNMLFFSGAQEF